MGLTRNADVASMKDPWSHGKPARKRPFLPSLNLGKPVRVGSDPTSR